MSYCSNCGKTLNGNLNYCNSCGTRVESKPVVVKHQGSPMLAIGGVFVGAIGLMAFYPILRELLRSPIDSAVVIVILVAYLLTVLSMFGILVWQGRRNTGEVTIKGNRTSDSFADPDAFRGINTAQLPEPTFQPASVTEHTTKTLDKVPFEKN